MKKGILPLMFILIGFTASLFAQHPKPAADPDADPEVQTLKSPVNSIPCQGSIHPEPGIHQDSWFKTIHNPGIEERVPDPERLKSIKKQKTATKFGANHEEIEGFEKTAEIPPLLGSNFEGNSYNGWTPPDNSMAISNGGNIVSVTNSSIAYANTSGTVSYYDSFDNFFSDATLTSALYDPVVHYDSGSDRFIMIVLHGTSPSTTKVVVCFSKTNDPSDGWWYYKFNGDPTSSGNWFDYPKIAVSTNELFITGNLFDSGDLFEEAIIMQIDKADGYAGASIDWVYWSGINGSPFTLLPVSYGHSGNYGPGIYLVATRSTSGSEVKFYEITNDMNNSPTLNYQSVTRSSYEVGGAAAQNGSSDLLDNGDCRALSGFYLDGYVHYVHASDIGSGWNGINYNRLNVSTPANETGTFGLTGSYDYCYPSVASFSSTTSDKAVCIGFNRSGSSIYPQCRAVTCDDAWDWSSSITTKTGESFVNISSGEQRWGDYTGISRKQNESTPTVWSAACYGKSDNKYGTWISEISAGAISNDQTNSDQHSIKVFPNPSIDLVNVGFELDKAEEIRISLVDLNGREIRVLFEDLARKGHNTFSFNGNALSQGTYIIQIASGSKLLHNEKITILH